MYTMRTKATHHSLKKNSSTYCAIILSTIIFLTTTIHAASPILPGHYSPQRKKSSHSCPDMPSPQRPPAPNVSPLQGHPLQQCNSFCPVHCPTVVHLDGASALNSCERSRSRRTASHSRYNSNIGQHSPGDYLPLPPRQPAPRLSPRRSTPRSSLFSSDDLENLDTLFGEYEQLDLHKEENDEQNNRYDRPNAYEQRERDHWENMLPYRDYPFLGLILLCYDNYPTLTVAGILTAAGLSIRNYDKIVELYKETKERIKKEFLRLKFRYVRNNGKKTSHTSKRCIRT